jgi:mannitol-1-/sugar-/sorbitol-6-phosphatase
MSTVLATEEGTTLRHTVECEAILFDLDVLTSGAVDAERVEPASGARFLLGHLPAGRWAVVTAGSEQVARRRLELAGLPVPDVLVATDVGPEHADFGGAIQAIGADPAFSVVVAGCPSTLEAAAGGELGVLAVAAAGEADDLSVADHVVPSLSSVRVLGHHPVLVLEVDTIPHLGPDLR